MLVLPPSFPFGGMENPHLTSTTPTVLAGDHSLVSLIAHELAHSWSGNLATNATWSDFWLNEGFTSYFENRIMEEVYGVEYARMLESLSRRSLADELPDLSKADQYLYIDLEGRDPDDGMTAIAYNKGAAFLRTIETAVWPRALRRVLAAVFQRARLSADDDGAVPHLPRRQSDRGRRRVRAQIQPEAWTFDPGLPPNVAPVASEAFAPVEAEAEAFTSSTAPEELTTGDWTTHEWLHFLDGLPDVLTAEQFARLDAAFGLTETGNSEILFAWLRTAIANRYEPAFPALRNFLIRQGRRKFVKPLYEDLVATDWGRPMAEQIYRDARPGYHVVSTNSIDPVVGWSEGE